MYIFMKSKKIYVLLCIIFVFPSIIYLVQKGTIENFTGYYSWSLIRFDDTKKIMIDSTIFLVLAISMIFTYFKIIKSEKFIDIKRVYEYILIISIIFFIGLPNMSSDIFYYLGVGWLDAKYHQNPYYVTVAQYRSEFEPNDTILNNTGFWSNTTSVYGSIWTLISKVTSFLSFGNITLRNIFI